MERNNCYVPETNVSTRPKLGERKKQSAVPQKKMLLNWTEWELTYETVV